MQGTKPTLSDRNLTAVHVATGKGIAVAHCGGENSKIKGTRYLQQTFCLSVR